MSVANTIRSKLVSALAPVRLDIGDDSHLHAGHAGARPEGETHFRLTIVTEVFDGMSRVARQRLVHDILSDELAGPVHALALTLRSPAEAARESRQGA
jgi:BolA protein